MKHLNELPYQLWNNPKIYLHTIVKTHKNINYYDNYIITICLSINKSL